MALDATLAWEVRTTGSDNSGGAFRAGASGTDFSQQDAAQKAGTDLAIHASDNTKVRPVAAGVAAGDIGNVIQVRAGSGFTVGFYEITAQDGTYWTLDRAAGTTSSSGGTYAMGGALASPGKACGALVPGNVVWIKAGTYVVTTTSINVSSGVPRYAPGSDATADRPSIIEGYQTTRGDKGTRPIVQLQASLTGSAITLFEMAGATNKFCILDNVDFDANTGNTNANGVIILSNYQQVWRTKIRRTTAIGFALTDQRQHASDIEVTEFSGTAGIRCYISADLTVILRRFVVHDGTCDGIVGYQAAMHFEDGLIFDCIGAAGGFFGGNVCGLMVDYDSKVSRVSIDNCTGNAITIIGRTTAMLTFTNVVTYGCTHGWAAEQTEGRMRVRLLKCAGGGHSGATLFTSSGTTMTEAVNCEAFVTLSADPFTDRANDDYGLNAVAGGGALLRATGGWSFGGQVSYADRGPLQHADPTAEAGYGMGVM